ncbi:CBS domain-containing protein [Streptomyces yangpuensis]|uniref:CBS domain-containing protein n=1 Tax=Streptomyces yangpuensis TaxID=1648182 RepID=UPI000629BB4A|nr:CBS domain-containing protein [Streptomyces yangpuensis]
MNVSEAMATPAMGVTGSTTIRDAARHMAVHGVGCLAVTEGGELLGVITDRDIVLRGVAPGLDLENPVREIMTAPAVTIGADDDISAAYRMFRTSGVRRLPVLDGRHVVGMLTVDDLLMDVFGRVADLLGPIAWSVLDEPPGPRDEIGPRAPVDGKSPPASRGS